jgi:hypothetical protein
LLVLLRGKLFAMFEPSKVAFGANCTRDSVALFAAANGFEYRGHREETATTDEETVWAFPNATNKMHRIVNSYLGVVHLMIAGDDAVAIAGAAAEALDGYGLGSVIELLQEKFDSAELPGTWAIGALGILAPNAFHSGVFEQFQRLFRHADPRIRLAALHSSSDPSQYVPWTKKLVSEWEQLSERDPDERVRRLARVGIDGATGSSALDPADFDQFGPGGC